MLVVGEVLARRIFSSSLRLGLLVRVAVLDMAWLTMVSHSLPLSEERILG